MRSAEPLWREVAHWGVIISFFTVPLVSVGLHIVWLMKPGAFPGARELTVKDSWPLLMSFHKVLAGLLAAMLGFNSWDKRLETEKGE